MSDMIDKVHSRKLAHLVRVKDKGFFYVDTARLEFYYSSKPHGQQYETMVFPYDIIKEEVISFSGLYRERYDDYMSAEEGHLRVCFHLEDYLDKGE